MIDFLKKFWPGEQAEALSEYALLLILVTLTALSAMKGLSGTVGHFFSNTSARVSAISNHQSINTGPLPDNYKINTKDPSDTKDKSLRPMS